MLVIYVEVMWLFFVWFGFSLFSFFFFFHPEIVLPVYSDEGKHAEMVVIGRRQLHTALKAEEISD